MKKEKILLLISTLLIMVAVSCKKKKTDGGNKDKFIKKELKNPKSVKKLKPAVEKKKPTVKKNEIQNFSLIKRAEFNQIAMKMNLPLFWIGDKNSNKIVDPSEITSLLFFYGTKIKANENWVKSGKFTPGFIKIYKEMVLFSKQPLPKRLSKGEKPDSHSLTDEELARRTLVMSDLDQGRPTLVFTDVSKFTDKEKMFLNHMQKVSVLIDGLYAQQNGTAGFEKKISATDTSSMRLFVRNMTNKCVAPKTEKNPKCASIKGLTIHSGVYPQSLQKGDEKLAFCKKLIELDKKIKENKDHLLYQFNVVKSVKGKLVAVPYTIAFKDSMSSISKELILGVNTLDKEEVALKAYLTAAAKAFLDNSWYDADKAWVKMNTHNTKWYVRVGPDEVYWDPCNRKAGFHFTLSRINPDSIKWQKKIEPIKAKMENEMAKLIGAPYKARKIGLHLPDFINIVTNAGNDKSSMGATIGQSLPNWGPVAKKGGRTVVMTNLYTDADSMVIRRKKALSIFSKESLVNFTDKQEPSTFSIILHEISHNLGPSHEYKFKNKKGVDWFGGSLATTMEELKAQTAALWYITMFLKEKLITKEFALETYIDSIYWAMGHISRGMYTTTKRARPYSHLAAIQLGFLMKEGAIKFDKNKLAANGKDKGAFILHLDKFPQAVNKLMKIVGKIKANGDKAQADKLIKEFVDSDFLPMKTIKERVLRYPKASFVYGWNLNK
jgi:hypothetical protein